MPPRAGGGRSRPGARHRGGQPWTAPAERVHDFEIAGIRGERARGVLTATRGGATTCVLKVVSNFHSEVRMHACLRLVVPVALLAAACGGDDFDVSAAARPVVARHVDNAYQAYGAALTGAKALDAAIDAFVKTPSADGLATAKKAWIDARVPYRVTEAYRFYNGPIEGAEERINS